MCGRCAFLFLLFFRQMLLAQQPTAGDVNNDGKVDSADVARGVQIALGKASPATQAEIAAGDMNRDGRITVQDLVFIRNTIAGANRPPVADASASPDSGLAGIDIQLDATNSFDLDGDTLTYRWRQLHMNRYSTEYMTENEAILSDSTGAMPTFNPEWPGSYRFELAVGDVAGLVEKDTIDVVVGREGGRKFDVKGIVFFDYFGENGGPQFDPLPENPDSLAAVQNRAMAAPVRVNAEWVHIVPVANYLQINPLPRIALWSRDHDLTDESELAAIVHAAKTKGLKFIFEQGDISTSPDLLRPGEIDSLDFLTNTSADWWDAWFTEFKNILLDRADWCEKYGVDMFQIMSKANYTFRPLVYPQYGERWHAIIDSVRAHYSGKVALHVEFPGDLTFADALDALFISLDANGILFWHADQISDIHNPTIEEIRAITESILDDHEPLVGGKVPVYYYFQAVSADLQPFFFPAPPMSELDYQEQVVYYEGIIQALEDERWVNGFSTWFWSWFDGMERPGIIWDEYTGVSPRDKPAEEVIKLWFGIY